MQSFLQYRRIGRQVREQYEQTRGQPRGQAASAETGRKSSRLSPGREPHQNRLQGDPESGSFAQDIAHHSDLERITSEKSVGSRGPLERTGTTLGRILTGVNVRQRTADEGGSEGKAFVVGFRGSDDMMDPQNWSLAKRVFATMNINFIAWIVGFASSVDTGALNKAKTEFGVSDVTESLATGLFLVGFGAGALISGPFSEEFGRNPVYIITMLVYMLFVMGSALAPSIGAQLVLRLIGGVFAATPLVCAGGSISDLWTPLERVFAFPMFALGGFSGPMIGPVVGGFIGQSSLSWRWCDWVTLIASGGILTSLVLFLPETYSPLLLKWKAAHLRQVTQDDRYVAPVEIQRTSLRTRVLRALYRPFLIFVQEPIVVVFGVYLTLIYIVMFGFLTGFNFIFADTYGLSEGLAGLCFLGVVLGIFLASLALPFVHSGYMRAMDKAQRASDDAGKTGVAKVPPEIRLWFAMMGGPGLPISLFWMGWTARPSVSIWAPLGACVLCGFSIISLFISSYQYLIDTYELYAASALAGVTVTRYVVAGAMVEVCIPMFNNLGVAWACTLLACLSALMAPVPFLLYRYGPKIRKLSKFAPAQ